MGGLEVLHPFAWLSGKKMVGEWGARLVFVSSVGMMLR